MNPYKYKISVRLEHPFLDLAEIKQRVIKLLPDANFGEVITAGKEIITKAGKETGSRYGKSFFNFSFSNESYNSESKNLEKAIRKILDKLAPCRELFNKLAEENISKILFAGIFLDKNSGIIFNSELIHELDEFGMEIQLDIYPPEKDE